MKAKMPFGIHKDKPINLVPTDYLQFILDSQQKLSKLIELELNKRLKGILRCKWCGEKIKECGCLNPLREEVPALPQRRGIKALVFHGEKDQILGDG